MIAVINRMKKGSQAIRKLNNVALDLFFIDAFLETFSGNFISKRICWFLVVLLFCTILNIFSLVSVSLKCLLKKIKFEFAIKVRVDLVFILYSFLLQHYYQSMSE